MRSPSYAQFARLRLRRLVPRSVKVVEHDGWEWMYGTWRYEGIGFTWFGRLEAKPRVTAGLEIVFEELSGASAKRILRAAGLPVSAGMRLAELRRRLGSPVSTEQFVSDRKTYVFLIGSRNRYRVGCTVRRRHGLIHVSVIREDVREQLVAT
jgi:hypothetical protein